MGAAFVLYPTDLLFRRKHGLARMQVLGANDMVFNDYMELRYSLSLSLF